MIKSIFFTLHLTLHVYFIKCNWAVPLGFVTQTVEGGLAELKVGWGIGCPAGLLDRVLRIPEYSFLPILICNDTYFSSSILKLLFITLIYLLLLCIWQCMFMRHTSCMQFAMQLDHTEDGILSTMACLSNTERLPI